MGWYTPKIENSTFAENEACFSEIITFFDEIKTSRFAEAKEWFEKKKAYDAKYPGGVPAGGAGMPGGAPAAKPPAPKVPEDLEKFMKLFKMGLPEQTIKNKMVMSGVTDSTCLFEQAKK